VNALVPLIWIPQAFVLLSLVVFAGVISPVVSSKFEWFIPGLGLRLAVALILCLGPGVNEVAGNLANLHWLFFLWLAWLGIQDPDVSLTKFDAIAAVLAAFTEGSTVVLIPLFLFRAIIRARRAGKLGASVMEMGIVALLLVMAVVDYTVRPAFISPPSVDLTLLWRVFWRTGFRSLFQPWLGDQATLLLEAHRALFSSVALVFLAVGGVVLFRKRSQIRTSQLTAFLFLICVLFWTLLACRVRPMSTTLSFLDATPSYWKERYAFPLGVASTLFWFALFRPEKRRLLGGLLVVTLLMSVPSRFWIPRYRTKSRWASVVPLLERSRGTGCPQIVIVPLSPEGWTIPFVSPRSASCN
jgi:hypothetical protein